MIFEQPKGFADIVGEPARLTWAYLWKELRRPFPGVLIAGFLALEYLLFNAWSRSEWNTLNVGLCVFKAFAIAAFVLLVLGLDAWLSLKSSRSLFLNAHGAGATGAQRQIRWARMINWWFEPLPNAPEHRKITVEFAIDKKRRRRRRWSMVLPASPDAHSLLSELRFRKQRSDDDFIIHETGSPPPVRKPKEQSVLPGYLMAAGLVLFLHGFPLLVGSFHLDDESPSRSSETELTPQQEKKLGEFFKAHFSNRDQFLRFARTGGVLLTSAAAMLFAGAVWLDLRARRSEDQLISSGEAAFDPQASSSATGG